LLFKTLIVSSKSSIVFVLSNWLKEAKKVTLICSSKNVGVSHFFSLVNLLLHWKKKRRYLSI
jgi:hypothetical protein